MNKIKIIRLTAMVMCAAMTIGTLFAGCGETVNTYAVSDIAYIDSWVDVSETSGEVRTSNMQTIYLTETQTVTDVFVTDGQQVKRGDKLMSYDTTLTDIELDKKELEVLQLELALQQAKENLSVVNSFKPMVVTVITPDPSGKEPVAVSGYHLLSGTGTQDDPFIFVVEDGEIPCSSSFIGSICPAGTDTVWAVYQTRSGNTTTGKITDHSGVRYKNSASGISISFFDASEFCVEEPSEPYEEIEYNSGLTAGEISVMRAEARNAVDEANYKYRVASLEYQQMLLEVDSGVVTAELDGTVVMVNDPQYALEMGEPVIKLSADGGYIVEGTLSELELDTVHVGQSVKVTSWECYQEFDAEITSISTIPTTQNGWTNGNTNVSYYPFTVYIDGSANLKEYEWVSVTYSSTGNQGDFFYLETAFVLSEGGKSWVYAQNDDGLLEKREIKTGEMLWGSYIKILSGISTEDRIAFPYDKNAKDGTKTVEAEISELYSYYG